MLHIFELPRVWENVESWLFYVNKLFWIAQPYFSSDMIKRSEYQLLLIAFKTFNKKNKIKFPSDTVLTVRISLYFNETKKIINCVIYIALAKHSWLIKLGECKRDQKYFAT